MLLSGGECELTRPLYHTLYLLAALPLASSGLLGPSHSCCRFDAPHSFGSDTCVLGAITRVCGPAIWLNTIVALTHAAAQPPASAAGTMSWEIFSSDRMQQLQHSIR